MATKHMITQENTPEASLAMVDPTLNLAVCVLQQAVTDLASKDLLIGLDALGWWLTDIPADWLEGIGLSLNPNYIFSRVVKAKGGKHGRSRRTI